VVQTVTYGGRSVAYRTFDPGATEVLRLSFKPLRITAGGVPLARRDDLNADGFTLKELPGGDWVVRIKHVNSGEISIGG
jgi:hypothetical protein